MDERLVDKTVHCPYCAEPVSITLDLSAGGQSYVEDCQVCCQPMQVGYETDGSSLDSVQVDRA